MKGPIVALTSAIPGAVWLMSGVFYLAGWEWWALKALYLALIATGLWFIGILLWNPPDE